MRPERFGFFLAVLCLPALAGDNPPRLERVVEPEARLVNRTVVVVDCSASMSGKYGTAVDCVSQLVSSGVDEQAIKVVAFNDGVTWWRDEWTEFPSADDRDLLVGWLEGLGAGGGTILAPALRQAIHDAKEAGAYVLVVTDGGITTQTPKVGWSDYDDCTRLIVEGEVVVAVVGVGGTVRAGAHYRVVTGLGRIGRGGCWVASND